MSAPATLPPAVPPTVASGPSTAPTAAGGTSASTRVSNAHSSTFAVPNGIALTQFDGLDWANWSNMLEAVLCLHEANDIIRHAAPPAGVDVGEWNTVHRCGLAYLCLFIKPDIYSLITSEVDYPTFFSKWELLHNTYGGAMGSTTIFNLWISITQARLNDSAPMAPPLAKLNETRVALFNTSMGITDTQYCLILLNTLPASYEVLASTILAAGAPTALKHTEITACILSEEARWSGPSGSSLNTAAKAPIKGKGKGKKWDHSGLTCHYCNKVGHIKPDCRKRKKDEAEEKKKEGSASGSKAANSHVKVDSPSTEWGASIVEVNDNEVGIALYAAERVRWMMDSGAMHNITPHLSDFKNYTPCQGTVRLEDKSTISQVGVGSVIFKTSPGAPPITLSSVLHIPGVRTRFMSTHALANKGVEVAFSKGIFKIPVNQSCVGVGYLEDNLYWLDISNIGLNLHIKSAATSLDTWHQHMGHMPYAAIKQHGPSALQGMDIDAPTLVPSVCHGCVVGKSTCQPFLPSRTKRTTDILQVVHSDLAGPLQNKSI